MSVKSHPSQMAADVVLSARKTCSIAITRTTSEPTIRVHRLNRPSSETAGVKLSVSARCFEREQPRVNTVHHLRNEEVIMRSLSLVVGILAAFAAADASAQSINLTGIYTCVEICRGTLPAHVTQNGPAVNLLTEAGVPARAWPDWFSPASRIWIDTFNEGAVYSPDGMLIQFDNGTIWRRGLSPPVRRQ
jgi:hypothetical protein